MTCPWQAMRDPFVGAVLRHHAAFKAGAIARPESNVPEALMRGLEVYDAALNRVTVHDLRAEQAEREREAETAREQSGVPRRRRR